MLLFFISLMVSKGKHVFICLGDICVSFSVNPCPLLIFPLRFWSFSYWVVGALYILGSLVFCLWCVIKFSPKLSFVDILPIARLAWGYPTDRRAEPREAQPTEPEPCASPPLKPALPLALLCELALVLIAVSASVSCLVYFLQPGAS